MAIDNDLLQLIALPVLLGINSHIGYELLLNDNLLAIKLLFNFLLLSWAIKYWPLNGIQWHYYPDFENHRAASTVREIDCCNRLPVPLSIY